LLPDAGQQVALSEHWDSSSGQIVLVTGVGRSTFADQGVTGVGIV